MCSLSAYTEFPMNDNEFIRNSLLNLRVHTEFPIESSVHTELAMKFRRSSIVAYIVFTSMQNTKRIHQYHLCKPTMHSTNIHICSPLAYVLRMPISPWPCPCRQSHVPCMHDHCKQGPIFHPLRPSQAYTSIDMVPTLPAPSTIPAYNIATADIRMNASTIA